jgi:uncharacterized protein YydD (DUF2326 family)
MMNMDAENTALLIRSLLSAIKQHENTLSAALFKLAEKTKTIDELNEKTKTIEELKKEKYELRISKWKVEEEVRRLQKIERQYAKLVGPKRGRGRPRKVKP